MNLVSSLLNEQDTSSAEVWKQVDWTDACGFSKGTWFPAKLRIFLMKITIKLSPRPAREII